MLKVKIHRGTDKIGGSITEIYTENTHIFIDFGSELNPDPDYSSDKDMVEMIQNSECDAVLFSHYHGDHIGLMNHIPEKDIRGRKIKLGMGLEARKVLIRIHTQLSRDHYNDYNGNCNYDHNGDRIRDFSDDHNDNLNYDLNGNRQDRDRPDIKEHLQLLELLKNRALWEDFYNLKTFSIGDFTITTVRVDHSAFDAYMFIIQAEGKTIVHTGDYRTHGRLGADLFPDLKEALEKVMNGKRPKLLLTEGTMLDRTSEKVMSEEELQKEATKILSLPENRYAFLVCSSTNVESLASFCNAANELHRSFFVNNYVYSQIYAYRKALKDREGFKFEYVRKFENMNTPNPKLYGLTQPEFMMKRGFLMMVGVTDAYIPRMECFRKKDPLLIYSMWNGYINKEKHPDTYDERYGRLYNSWRHIPLHTSGHATVEDIEKMIHIVNAESITPIHTTKKNAFENLDTGSSEVIIHNDGDEWAI